MREILLFTDFGWQGPYLGQMLSILHRTAPGVSVVNLQCDAPAFDSRRSAYLLGALVAQGPADALWLCVVDPGVGGGRKALMAEAAGRWLVGPDNGLLTPALRRLWRKDKNLKVWAIDWPPGALSPSFHGRDLFAPVAARLALEEAVGGVPLDQASLVGWDWEEDLSEIVYVDRFGNAMTGIRAGQLDPSISLVAGGREVAFARTFSDVKLGEAFWYVNSLGLAEIAVNQGRADRVLGLDLGSPVLAAE